MQLMKDDRPAPPGRLTLVLGGVRSGKSAFAERLALAATSTTVTYVATARAGDGAMSERIARHQRRREEYGPAWQTIEEPRQLAPVLRQTQGCRLIECVPLWLTGLLCDPPVLDDDAVAAAMQEFVTVVGTTTSGPVIVVSAEAGLGMLPPNELARRFADALGSANQQLAAVATDVWLVVAGLPVRLKGGGGEAS